MRHKSSWLWMSMISFELQYPQRLRGLLHRLFFNELANPVKTTP